MAKRAGREDGARQAFRSRLDACGWGPRWTRGTLRRLRPERKAVDGVAGVS